MDLAAVVSGSLFAHREPVDGLATVPVAGIENRAREVRLGTSAPMGRGSNFTLLAVIALAIPISTSTPAAGPDWPKSLTLATASGCGLSHQIDPVPHTQRSPHLDLCNDAAPSLLRVPQSSPTL